MSAKDTYFMEIAVDLALKARKEGDEPFGALLVYKDQVVKTSENQVHTLSDPTAHAELKLIREYCSENRIEDLSEYTLYTSCEPCAMCSGAMVWSKLGRLVYGVSHDALAKIAGDNIMIGCEELFEKSPHSPDVKGGVLKSMAIKVFDDYIFGGH